MFAIFLSVAGLLFGSGKNKPDPTTAYNQMVKINIFFIDRMINELIFYLTCHWIISNTVSIILDLPVERWCSCEVHHKLGGVVGGAVGVGGVVGGAVGVDIVVDGAAVVLGSAPLPGLGRTCAGGRRWRSTLIIAKIQCEKLRAGHATIFSFATT